MKKLLAILLVLLIASPACAYNVIEGRICDASGDCLDVNSNGTIPAEWSGGAVNTCVATTVTEINTCITNATAGDTIVLPSSSIAVGAGETITVNKAVRLLGNGTKFTRGAVAGTTVISVTASNAMLEGITIETTGNGPQSGNEVSVSVNGTAGTVLSGVVLKDVNVIETHTGGSAAYYGILFDDASGFVYSSNVTYTSGVNAETWLYAHRNAATAEATTTVKVYDSTFVNNTTAYAGTTINAGFYVLDSSATQDAFTYAYNVEAIVQASSSSADYAALANNGDAFLYMYNSTLSGGDFDIGAVTSSAVQLYGCHLANSRWIGAGNGTVTVDPWNTWTPSLTWTTGTPASPTTVARYQIQGSRVFFVFESTSADGNGGTALTVTLPITPKDVNEMNTVSGIQLQNATYSNPLSYIDQTNDTAGNRLLTFRALSTCTDGEACSVFVSGSYEI